MQVVIMAGGKGTRISSVAADIPKPMIRIGGKPVLQLLVESLCGQGYRDIIMVTGHLGGIIEAHFGDGSSFGCDISYYREESPLGTAGALYYLKDRLEEDFFLLNADALMSIDLKRMESFYRAHDCAACILVHPNDHPFDSSTVKLDSEYRVTRWCGKGEYDRLSKNRVNAGVHILNKTETLRFISGSKTDLDKQVLAPLVSEGKVCAYESSEYIKDMGTPERYEAVCADYLSGRAEKRCLKNKQRAVFLDRDGTLNVYKGFITDPEQIELEEGAASAVRTINKSSYLAIVVTNQPVVARGDCTFEEVEQINGRLEALLGDEGAYVDDVFYCPHHPDKGFEGERKELKIECSCRKPKPGLLYKAAEKYNIDLAGSYMVGDRASDVKAGLAAGCKAVYIGRKPDEEAEGAMVFDSLSAFAEALIKE
ncbi:MAG: HAD-IIIA family hydrolase [Ruminococcus sp.]|nr:HAD-IIIA family hydrolase [Ruminococcus sp.]